MSSLWDCEKCGYNHYDKADRCKHCGAESNLPDMVNEQGRKDDSAKPKYSHYFKDVRHIDTIDIYTICNLYVKDNSGCIQHAVKKLLCCGERGVKDNVKDLNEAIDTIKRKIELLESAK